MRHPLVARIVAAYESQRQAIDLISPCNTPVTVKAYPCVPILCAGHVPRLAGGGEITIRLVEADEGQALNNEYRGKDYATNVYCLFLTTRNR